MLETISALLEGILALLPTIARRPTTVEWMVVDSHYPWSPKKVYLSERPILHIPAFTAVEYYSSAPITLPMETQTLRTADNVEVTVNVAIKVVIEDPIAMRHYVGSDDYISNIVFDARSATSEFITGNNYLYGLSTISDLGEEISDSISYGTGAGVQVVGFSLEDYTRTTTRRLLHGLPEGLSGMFGG